MESWIYSTLPPSAEAALAAAGASRVERLAGGTAWETSAKVAERALTLGMSADGVGAADGNGYWDALTGAALCGHSGAPLMLVRAEIGRASCRERV